MTAHQLAYLSCIVSTDRDPLLRALASHDVHVITLLGDDVTDEPSLMHAVGQQMGLGERMRPTTWDGFRDALFEVMTAPGASLAAVVWEGSDHMVSGDLQDFLQAATLLHDVAIATRRAADVRSFTFFLGSGPGYRPFTSLEGL